MGKRYKAEEIVMKLREIELSINKGMDVVHAPSPKNYIQCYL